MFLPTDKIKKSPIKGHEETSEGDGYAIYLAVIVSQVHTYAQIHQTVGIKYEQLF